MDLLSAVAETVKGNVFCPPALAAISRGLLETGAGTVAWPACISRSPRRLVHLHGSWANLGYVVFVDEEVKASFLLPRGLVHGTNT